MILTRAQKTKFFYCDYNKTMKQEKDVKKEKM